jgi:hypothetical protein
LLAIAASATALALLAFLAFAVASHARWTSTASSLAALAHAWRWSIWWASVLSLVVAAVIIVELCRNQHGQRKAEKGHEQDDGGTHFLLLFLDLFFLR